MGHRRNDRDSSVKLSAMATALRQRYLQPHLTSEKLTVDLCEHVAAPLEYGAARAKPCCRPDTALQLTLTTTSLPGTADRNFDGA